MSDVRIFPSFVSLLERQAIGGFARKIRIHLKPNPVSPRRYFQWLSALPEIADEILQIEYRVWDASNFTASERDPIIAHYLSVNEPGGAVHLHTDPGISPDHVNVRFNVMIEKPVGGEPVIADKILPVASGDAWAFIATTYRHRSQLVVEGWRIVVGFGFQIPRGDPRLSALGIA